MTFLGSQRTLPRVSTVQRPRQDAGHISDPRVRERLGPGDRKLNLEGEVCVVKPEGLVRREQRSQLHIDHSTKLEFMM